MSRSRIPLAKAYATGRLAHDPKRFRGRSDPQAPPLGDPDTTLLSPVAVAAWHAFRREIPWLTEADRALLEMASELRAQLWIGDAEVMPLLLRTLHKMGATPADRSRVHVPPDDGDDAAAEFIN